MNIGVTRKNSVFRKSQLGVVDSTQTHMDGAGKEAKEGSQGGRGWGATKVFSRRCITLRYCILIEM